MTRGDEPVRSTIQKRDDKGVIRHGAEWLAMWADPDSMKSAEELESDRHAARSRTAFEKFLAATTRALSAKPDLSVTFVSDDQHAGTGLALNHLPRKLDARSISAARGEADSQALFLRYHDSEIHRRYAPDDSDRRRLYDLCERVRCEALGARRFFGIEGNLIAHQLDRLRRLDLLNAHLASLIPLEQGLQMVLRDTLVGRDDPSVETSGFWMWDRWLRDRFTSQLNALHAAQTDQARFARLSLNLLESVLNEVGSLRTDKGSEKTGQGTWQPDELGDEPRLKDEMPSGELLQPGGMLFVDEDVGERLETVADDPADVNKYHVYSREHDLVARAEALAANVELRDVRETLDKKRVQYRRELSRLTARLQRKLMARQVRAWSFDQDEGLIDAARLDRVIVNPGFASAYKQEQETDFPDSAVTILIDNSGSMRGKPIEIACIATDLISAALDHCGITNEVLGFTTRQWKGGQSGRDWKRAGRSANPGRLNDLMHVIYKSADEPYRRARPNLCAMVSNDLLKENIDGEALLWAASRLLARPEQRKILLVISDGAPVDQATLEANEDKRILDRHLIETTDRIQKSTPIELAAIGIKHDVARYYDRAVKIEKVDDLGRVLVDALDSLLS